MGQISLLVQGQSLRFQKRCRRADLKQISRAELTHAQLEDPSRCAPYRSECCGSPHYSDRAARMRWALRLRSSRSIWRRTRLTSPIAPRSAPTNGAAYKRGEKRATTMASSSIGFMTWSGHERTVGAAVKPSCATLAVVSGNCLGVSLTSLATLGQHGVLGQATQGRSGEQVYVNIANGNLVLQDRDDFLAEPGLNEVALRT